MSIWIEITLVSLLVASASLWPVFRRASKNVNPVQSEDDSAIGVEKRLYQQRLSELEADIARGALDENAAQEARAELGRSLIASAEQTTQSGPKRDFFAAPLLTVTVLLAIGAAYGLYAKIGAPTLHNQLAQSTDLIGEEQVSVETAIERVEKQMQQTPNDVRGWQVLAPIYRRLGENEKAINAMRQILALAGPTVANQTELAELLLLVDGPANRAEAVTLLNAARQSAPDEIRPQFMLAIVAMQEERFEQASALWSALLARVGQDVEADEAWVSIAREGLTQARAQSGDAAQTFGAETPAEPETLGPSQSDITNAGQMSADERQDMIKNMVESLDQRLQTEGGSVAEWQQLVRALNVLGQSERAAQALTMALENLTEETDRQAMEIFATELGLDSTLSKEGSQ